ncbi:MAG: transcription antitermination factor NusB, partial [Blastocatellia bacterium]
MNVKVSPSRLAAFDVLWRVTTEDAYASNLFASPRYDHLSREDRGLAQELSLGVLRWQIRLDFFIERYAQRKLDKLDQEVVIALRLGLYQLKFLSRIPPHAAINESVNLVKERGKRSAAAFVNAVLRGAQREESFDFSQSIKDSLRRLSGETAHPAWLLERWIKRFGEDEARAMAMANNSTPHPAFRFNPRVKSETEARAWLDESNVAIQPSSLTPGAFIVESGSLSAQSEPVREGWVYLQDEASQLVAHLAAGGVLKSQTPNPKLLDLCAAPGGKTTLLASLLSGDVLIVASDLHLHRLRTMKELSARLGVNQINLIQLDATRDLPFDAAFDLALL